jgi:hypothetical protein
MPSHTSENVLMVTTFLVGFWAIWSLFHASTSQQSETVAVILFAMMAIAVGWFHYCIYRIHIQPPVELCRLTPLIEIINGVCYVDGKEA